MPANATTHFVVGRDRDGHWLAVEIHGWGGGWFRSCKDALHYAEFQTDRRPGAVELSERPIELKI